MTRLVIDTDSAPAWEPGASVEVRLIAPDVEHTVTGTLVDARSPADPSPEPLREALTPEPMRKATVALLDAIEEALSSNTLPANIHRRMRLAYNAVVEEANR